MKRKVGQDMVIRKKTSAPAKAPLLSRSNIPQKPIPPVDVQTPIRREPRRPDDAMFSEVFSPHHYQAPQPPARGGILWVFAGAAIIGLVVTVLSLITRATINITLQEKTYIVDMPVNLYAEPTEGQIAFKTAKIVDKQSVIVPTTQKQSTSVSATGTVQLFSSSAKPVTVPAGTQLVSTAKKTFITKTKVVIPAGTTKTPGSVKVVIVATVPGAESNIKLDDLRLPLFPQVIARTTTEVVGGISGDQFTLTEAQLTAARATLQGQIALSNPAAFLANQIPDNFVLPQSLLQVSEISYHTESVQNGVSVIAERTITGNMIEKDNFKQFLINQIPETDRPFMQVFQNDNISFALTSTAVPAPSSVENITLSVHITGSFIARAGFNEPDIRTKIAHAKKSVAGQTLGSVPGVISAKIHMWPPWVRRVPNKVSAIIFKITYEPTQ